MKALNLVDINKSDVKYVISKFPDGQQDVRITGLEIYNPQEWGAYLRSFSVQIRARLDNFRDLELIVCATRALQNLRVKEIHLYIPHILGARSDRKFQEGGTRYLSQVLAPIINMLEFETVTCIDVHSDVAENVIERLQIVSNIELVRWALSDIYKPQPAPHIDDFVLVSPDAGAMKKIYKVSDSVGRPKIITCSKFRDVEGDISRTVVPDIKDHLDKDFIIVDDICDGGATFIAIAKIIRSWYDFKGRIFLVVTHSIFSKGFGELLQYFDGIYSTNSYKDIEYNSDSSTSCPEKYKDKVKQMNVI